MDTDIVRLIKKIDGMDPALALVEIAAAARKEVQGRPGKIAAAFRRLLEKVDDAAIERELCRAYRDMAIDEFIGRVGDRARTDRHVDHVSSAGGPGQSQADDQSTSAGAATSSEMPERAGGDHERRDDQSSAVAAHQSAGAGALAGAGPDQSRSVSHAGAVRAGATAAGAGVVREMSRTQRKRNDRLRRGREIGDVEAAELYQFCEEMPEFAETAMNLLKGEPKDSHRKLKELASSFELKEFDVAYDRFISLCAGAMSHHGHRMHGHRVNPGEIRPQ